MKRNTIPFLVLVVAFTLGECDNRVVRAEDASTKPNIIFILADDQGWNGTSVQMHPELPNSKSDYHRTPNLELLARRGMRFSQAYAPGPMCSPSRASFQTGKSPAQLHITNVGRSRPARHSQRLLLPKHSINLPTDEVTIGEVLRDTGYATAWFGKWHLGGNQGPGAHGYDTHDGATENSDGVTQDPDNPKDIFGITERGMAFMEESKQAGKPFYLQLWHYAVHGPFQSSSATEVAYRGRTAGEVHRSPIFAAMTEDLDTSVGMILDKLEDLGIADNTYVVYMSDHGSGGRSSNAPLRQGKGTLWEGGLRVPLIISGPGVKEGEFCQVPIVGWDMFPTFCDWAGVQDRLPTGVEGTSIGPLLATGTGELKREHDGIAFHFPHYGQGGRGQDNSPLSTLVYNNHKLMKLYETNQLRLFDLGNDISERNDLAKSDPEMTRSMHRMLQSYLQRIDAGIPVANPDYDPSTGQQDRTPRRRRRGAGSNRPSQH